MCVVLKDVMALAGWEVEWFSVEGLRQVCLLVSSIGWARGYVFVPPKEA